MRAAVTAAVIVLFAGAGTAIAQVNVWHFKELPYYEPLKADPRAARMTLIVPAWSEAFPHSFEPGTRFIWQITLGRELPIVGMRTRARGQ